MTVGFAASVFATVDPTGLKDVLISSSLKIGGTGIANSKAAIEINSTTKGILLPRLTTAQRTAITSVPQGLMLYDTDLTSPYIYDGSGWVSTGVPTVGANAGKFLQAGSPNAWATVGVTAGGTGQTSWTLGDLLYSDATNSLAKLAGNITSTKKFLNQTGTGAVSAAPVWTQPACSDLSGVAASCSTDATNASNISSGTLAVARGGTGQTTYTDGQLLIGNTSGNTLSKATITAGSNITVTNGNGTIQIAASSSAVPAWTYVSQSSTLNPAVVGDYYLLSGNSFTITLPTAASISGQGIMFQHNGTSESQIYTLATAGGQTIGGVTSTNYVLHSNKEILYIISDGTNWQIIQHKTKTNPVVFTPTYTNFGTVVTSNVFSWRDGSLLCVGGGFTAPTTGANPASMTMGFDGTNNNISADTTLLGANATAIGTWGSTSFQESGLMLTTNSASSIQFGQPYTLGSTAPLSQANANSVVASGGKVSLNFCIPISGWQP